MPFAPRYIEKRATWLCRCTVPLEKKPRPKWGRALAEALSCATTGGSEPGGRAITASQASDGELHEKTADSTMQRLLLFSVVDSRCGHLMSIEDRIRKTVEEVLACEDDGKAAVLAEELLDALRLRVVHLREKRGLIPLGPQREPIN